jgi:hypothetical protein
MLAALLRLLFGITKLVGGGTAAKRLALIVSVVWIASLAVVVIGIIFALYSHSFVNFPEPWETIMTAGLILAVGLPVPLILLTPRADDK